MKMMSISPNKHELRKMLQGLLAQERVAEAHLLLVMLRQVGLPVDVVTCVQPSHTFSHLLPCVAQVGLPVDVVMTTHAYNLLTPSHTFSHLLPYRWACRSTS